VYEAKQLPAITESTELQSLNSPPTTTPNHHQNGSGKPYDYMRVAQWNGSVPVYDAKSHKFDPKLIKKAENLLGGVQGANNNLTLKTSLDNTDLTITSLNYIDEYQNSVGRNLQNLYVKSPEIEKK
jgi:sodium-dependent phosphate transporter